MPQRWSLLPEGKGKHEAALATRDGLNHKMQQLVLKLNTKIDLPDLKETIASAESCQPACDDDLLRQMKGKLAEVERLYAARRKKETLAELTSLAETPPLSLDTDAFAAALTEAEEANVDDEALAPMRTTLQDAVAAQRAHFEAKHLELLSCLASPLSADVAAVEAAIAAAREVRLMPDSSVERAHTVLAAAKEREAAGAALASEVAKDGATVDALRRARSAAMRAGVPMVSIDERGAAPLNAAEAAGAAALEAEATLAWSTARLHELCTAATPHGGTGSNGKAAGGANGNGAGEALNVLSVGALDDAVVQLKAAHAAAAAAGSTVGGLSAAEGAIGRGEKALALRDQAVACVVACAAAALPSAEDVAAAQQMLPVAAAAGVCEHLLATVSKRLEEAEKAASSNAGDAPAAVKTRHELAKARTLAEAKPRAAASAKTVKAAVEAEKSALAALASATADAEKATADVTAAKAAVAEADEAVATLEEALKASTDATAALEVLDRLESAWEGEVIAARVKLLTLEAATPRAVAATLTATLASEAAGRAVGVARVHEARTATEVGAFVEAEAEVVRAAKAAKEAAAAKARAEEEARLRAAAMPEPAPKVEFEHALEAPSEAFAENPIATIGHLTTALNHKLLKTVGLKKPGRIAAKKAAEEEREKQARSVPLDETPHEPPPPPPAPMEEAIDSLAFAALYVTAPETRVEILRHLARGGLFVNATVGAAVATALGGAADGAAEAFLTSTIAAASSADAASKPRGSVVGGGGFFGGVMNLIGLGAKEDPLTTAAAYRPTLEKMQLVDVRPLVESWLPVLASAGGDAAAVLVALLAAPHGLGVELQAILDALLAAHPAADDAARPKIDAALVLLLAVSGGSPTALTTATPAWLNAEASHAAKAKAAAEGTLLQPSALVSAATALGAQLAATAAAYVANRDRGALSPAEGRLERAILCLASLFVKRPDALAAGFQALVPAVFDTFLAKGTKLRAELCTLLKEGGMEAATVERVSTDDTLVRQAFFWSAPGSKLFGNHPDLKDVTKLKALLNDALAQQPTILFAFLEQASARAERADSAAAAGKELADSVASALHALLTQIAASGLGYLAHADRRQAVQIVLLASSKRPVVYDACVPVWASFAEASSTLLADFATGVIVPRLKEMEGRPSLVGSRSSNSAVAAVQGTVDATVGATVGVTSAAIKGLGSSLKSLGSLLPGGGETVVTTIPDADLKECIEMLSRLFIAKPSELPSFRFLVPLVFNTVLKLGSPPRQHLNELLLSGDFDKRLEVLVCESDEFVSAPFFWNAQVMPLCTSALITQRYPQLNAALLTEKSGKELHLYSRLLALLLRLSSLRGGDPEEIARRVREVLDQLERNQDQQQFLLTILHTLEKRCTEQPDLFDGLALTVLGGVCANGVATLSSVSGKGLELCQEAMTTLLQGYVREAPPDKWAGLFKDATNIAFMVKYMFRESLDLAKEKFRNAVNETPRPEVAQPVGFFGGAAKPQGPDEVKELLGSMVHTAMTEYGNVGIFDPEELAGIDFLNKPELLLALVKESTNRASRINKPGMLLMTNITFKWMEMMVERKFPPLTPHHTQAFTVLLMSGFFGDYLGGNAVFGQQKKPTKLKLKAFIAQLATGEGKSIVIAMLAIFMVKIYGMRVHVLENNEGLLERDYATNAPFYEKFGIKSGKDIGNEETQICYCLKQAINKHFLKRMVAGKLDADLSRTVLIVDEVDDLIVNEKPTAHYVKQDDEKSPAFLACYKALKDGKQKPRDVSDDVWEEAKWAVQDAKHMQKDRDYRIIKDAKGNNKIVILDSEGRVPKVALTAPWLKYMEYVLHGKEPKTDTHWACICTPYIFNKYAGIFGLTGSVGGKAELSYLTNTYHAIKYDVPRFLDTCTGDARKPVKNLGVELHDGAEPQLARVLDLANKYFKKVPVLIICASGKELSAVQKKLQEEGKMPSEEVQRLSEFDATGKSMRTEWQTVIDDATKRLGGADDNRCRVTVTDRFGGRGHDFQVNDKEANANGGMLVIATSIPDEREWIQWRGRTARQDRPGQFVVVLNTKGAPFDSPVNRGLSSRLRGTTDMNARITMLLDVADAGIGDKLKNFADEQAIGEKLNELTERYYRQHPRAFEDPWPSKERSDLKLRSFLTEHRETPPHEIKRLAKAAFGIDLES